MSVWSSLPSIGVPLALDDWPNEQTRRQGFVDFAGHMGRRPYLRVIADDGTNDPVSEVMLDREQATKLRDNLTAWLEYLHGGPQT